MLPGFRFLLAAIVLSMSVLVFGLGAAALLRAAHEEFASMPAWRVAPEPKFARQNEAPTEEPLPVLALLRVEPEPAPSTEADAIPVATAPAEPAAIAAVPDQPEKIAALEPQDKTPEAATPDVTPPEISVQSEAPAIDTTPAPAPAEETRIAAAQQILPPAPEAAASAAEPAPEPPAAGTDLIAAKIATLGGPPVAIEAPPPAKAAIAKPDPGVAKKRQQARRAEARAKAQRKIALRARQAATQQQAADPFAQPAITTRSR